MKWIDTKIKGISLHMIEMPDGAFAIGISGMIPANPAWQKAISAHNFRVSASGRMLLRQGGIKFGEIKSIFPMAVVTDVAPEQVYVQRKKVSDRTIVPDTQASTFIGKNYLGQDVYTTQTGSRYINGRDGQPISEETVAVAPAFLRVVHPGDIDLCADGFVNRMETEYLRGNDIRQFCASIFNETAPVEVTDSRLRDVQEAIEAAIFRKASKKIHETGDIKTGFYVASSLEDKQPPMSFRSSTSVELQQYSTPITLSVAAQYALGNTDGCRVLEPTIGNASLVTALSGARVTGVELDKARLTRTKMAVDSNDFLDASGVNLIHGNFLDMEFGKEFDDVIANPPFGGLPKPITMNGMRVTRLDHQILMKSLDHRKDDGRSVFIIGADRDTMFKGNEGKISGGSEKLFAWLADHYHVRAIEIDGDMYKKQGANYPVRMIAVGAKRTEDEARRAKETREFRIDRLTVVKTIDELWSSAASMREFLAQWAANDEKPEVESRELSEEEKKQAEEDNQSFGNEFQSQYIPMVQGSTSAMIPKNLVVPQQIAFNRFLKDHSDPIAFVKTELQMDDLSGFEPEQIDAIALGIWNMKRGRALILADQTGMGKGRIVAAIARWAAINGRQTNFLTEKASLFSDFWRDVRDIDSEDSFTTFILNADEQVVSLDGEDQAVIIPKTSNAVRQRLISSGLPPIEDGYNLMLATYSQFNRPEVKSAKASFIKDASAGGLIIMDESHNAAGDSNTGRNITEAVMVSGSALYSSATYAKNAKSMSVYYKAFPESVEMTSLTETLIAGGEPLQEVLSAMLCEDGVLVRREHDLSHLKFTTLDVPAAAYSRNVEISDQISDILAAMSFFSGDVERVAKQLDKEIQDKLKSMTESQREGKRMGVSYTNFGSRLYSISRQISLILSTDQIVDNALRALRNGQKPVIVLEQTMESIMNELLDDMSAEEKAAMDASATGMNPLTVKHLLHRLLQKMCVIVRTEDYGNKERVLVFDADSDPESRKLAQEAVESLQKMIDSLPDIQAMPLDIIHHRITKEGYACGEVSGRSTTYQIREDGMVVPEKNLREKNSEIFRFNSGEYDAIILTRSGCTGLSAHASEKFADRRQRVMIEAQIAANVNERVQFFGRVNRRGQVSVPEIWSITSGLPWENRILAMQNMKLRKLSANTQSNRNNAAEMKDIPDVLNPVGNEVCKAFLMSNPDIMTRLSIDPDREEDGQNEDGCYFANKLTGRMCLLRVAEQEAIYAEITDEYRKVINDLNNKGINPLESRVLDVKAEVIDKKIIVPGTESGSVFDSPVYAEKIGWTENVEPIRAAAAIEAANKSIEKMIEKSGIKLETRTEYQLPWDLRQLKRDLNTANLKLVDLTDYLVLVKNGFTDAAVRSIPERFINPDDPDAALRAALADKEMNAVKRIHNRLQWAMSNIPSLMPGHPIKFSSDEGVITGVILSVSTPAPGKEHHLGAWEIKVLPVGAQKTINMTYNTLIDDAEYSPVPPHEIGDVYKMLDAAPSGKLHFSKWTLTGNLFRASELAAKSRIGRAGIYTDKEGCRHRAILCRSSVNLDDLFSMEITVTEKDAREYISDKMATDANGEINFGDGFLLKWSNHGEHMRLIAPGTKNKGGRVFLDDDIRKFTGDFSGSRQVMSAEFKKPRNMDDFIGAIYKAGLTVKKRVDAHKEVDSTSLGKKNKQKADA